jgi:hypothetical protein
VNLRFGALALLALSVAICSPPSSAQPAPPAAPRIGEMKPLGNDRFQIGRIVVDKRAGRFTVPGRVLNLGKPLEYLATSPGGAKAYETLVEVDASGSEFNLGCILLGLERPADPPAFQRYSRAPLAGPRAAVYIAWSDGGKRRKVPAEEALHNPQTGAKPGAIEWVYVGSPASRPGGPFAADVTGVLIGFVHDPTSVIESVGGIGIGAYGSVQGNTALPSVGSSIELIVEVSRGRK